MSSATEIREIQIQARKKHIRLKTRNKKKVNAFLANLTTDEAKKRRQHFDNYIAIWGSRLVFFRSDFLKISAVICRQEMSLFVSRHDEKHKTQKADECEILQNYLSENQPTLPTYLNIHDRVLRIY